MKKNSFQQIHQKSQHEVASTSVDTSGEALLADDDECVSEISVEMDQSEEEEEEDVSKDPDWEELEEVVSEFDDDKVKIKINKLKILFSKTSFTLSVYMIYPVKQSIKNALL